MEQEDNFVKGNQMEPGIYEILFQLAAKNGALVYDDECMVCKTCGAEALGPERVEHKKYCLVVQAQKLLAGKGY